MRQHLKFWATNSIVAYRANDAHRLLRGRPLSVKSILGSVGLFCLAAASTQAASISVGGSAPATNVASYSQTTEDKFFLWDSLAANDFHNHGSTFQVAAGETVLDKITIKMTGGGSAVANLPLRFLLFHASQSADGGGTFAATSGAPDPSTIEAEFTGTANIAANSTQFITFDFDDVSLIANDWYGFYAIIDGFNASYNFEIAQNIVDTTFPGMWLRYYDAAAYLPTAGDDSIFWVQTAIPEPSSCVLAGMGLAGLIGWSRRRRAHG